jgi:aspartyl/asparaginyl beta-hydroxylase (cupin superfamily)
MAINKVDIDFLTKEGLAALRRGDGGTAHRQLSRLAAEADGAVVPWLALAQACKMMGDSKGEMAALQKQLALNSSDLPTLLMMAEAKVRANDDRAATSFYQSALHLAQTLQDIPQILIPQLQKGQAFLQQGTKRYEEHLQASLQKSGALINKRVQQSLDLLLGKTELYQQQPSMFYFPGLPQKQFYERSEFAWAAEMEAAIPDMCNELQSILAQDTEFKPYIEAHPDRPRPNNTLLDDPSWGAYYFWKDGIIVSENADKCPKTMAALARTPMPKIDSRSPMALYSLLKPGTHIAPHHGLLNTRLICHVPLILPGSCALRVGNEVREWRENELIIFDDSFEHEAWNRSDKTRVVLLFEIWRPEINADERATLTTIFEAINDYGSMPNLF